MVVAIRQSNPYAQQLDFIIEQANLEPLPNEEFENQILRLHLEEYVNQQTLLLHQICTEETKFNS
jgi:hypothetical protein